MTKADLADILHADAGYSKKDAADLVDLFFSSIKAALCNHDKVKLSRFGHFEVRQKRSRLGRNPQTGDAMEISARRVIVFRPSQSLRAALQNDAALKAHINQE